MNVASVARRGEVHGAIGAAGLLEAQGHAREAPWAQKRHQVTLHGLEIPWIIMGAPWFFPCRWTAKARSKSFKGHTAKERNKHCSFRLRAVTGTEHKTDTSNHFCTWTTSFVIFIVGSGDVWYQLSATVCLTKLSKAG